MMYTPPQTSRQAVMDDQQHHKAKRFREENEEDYLPHEHPSKRFRREQTPGFVSFRRVDKRIHSHDSKLENQDRRLYAGSNYSRSSPNNLHAKYYNDGNRQYSSPLAKSPDLTTNLKSSPADGKSAPACKNAIISISSDTTHEESTSKKQKAEFYTRAQVEVPHQFTHGDSVTRRYRARMQMEFSPDLWRSAEGLRLGCIRLDESMREIQVERREAVEEILRMKEFVRFKQLNDLHHHVTKTTQVLESKKKDLEGLIESLKRERDRAMVDLKVVEDFSTKHIEESTKYKRHARLLELENEDLRRQLGLKAREEQEKERDAEWRDIKVCADFDQEDDDGSGYDPEVDE